MISPKTILETINATIVESGAVLTETVDNVILQASLTAITSQLWRDVGRQSASSPIGSISFQDALGLQCAPETLDVGAQVLITISKPRADKTAYFYTIDGLQTLLADFMTSSHFSQVLLALDFPRFSSELCTFDTWSEIRADENITKELINPRLFVRELGTVRAVPVSVGHLVLKQIPAESAVFDCWRDYAITGLRRSLASEIFFRQDDEFVAFIGPQTRDVPLGEAGSGDKELVFAELTEAARWVFLEGSDIEARHDFYTNEVARIWPQGDTWWKMIALTSRLALAAAGNAYRLLIGEISVEALKALSDLRKTLSEEIAKVTNFTRDLSASLWRDFVVVVAAIVTRAAISPAATKPSSASVVVTFATIAYLGVSVAVTITTNKNFLQNDLKSRQVWRKKVYGFVSDVDFKELADEPLSASIQIYRKTACTVMIVALCLACLVVFTSAFADTRVSANNTFAPTASRVGHKHVIKHTLTTVRCHASANLGH